MNGGANNLILELPAEVHGMVARNPSLDAQVQMKKLSKKLDFLQFENDHYAKLVKEIPNAKEELSQLKNMHFQLQRENAGLRSQLESIFDNMKEEVNQYFFFNFPFRFQKWLVADYTCEKYQKLGGDCHSGKKSFKKCNLLFAF